MSKYEEAIELLRRIERENFNVDEDLKEDIQHFLWSLPENGEDEEKVKCMEELDENTPIGWWNENRRKINEIIRLYNEWQTVHHFDRYQKEIVKGRSLALKKWAEEGSEFSDWQIEILDEIVDSLDSH